MPLQNLYYSILLLLAFPAGLILAKMCEEEIKNWRKRLIIISIISLISTVFLSFISLNLFIYKLPVIISLFFIIITCLTIVWISYKKSVI